MLQMLKAKRAQNDGFTLIELLIAIVVVGVLAAVVIVGVGSLTDNGKGAACNASIDSAEAAQTVYYANNSKYPADVAAMVGKELQLSGATVTVNKIAGTGWSVEATGGGAAPLVFGACVNA
jgi:general secretion pathway protein G